MPAFWTAMSRKNQLMVQHGIPAAIFLLGVFWVYKSLGALGQIDNSIDTDNKFPGILQRNTPDGIWAGIDATQTQIATMDATIATGPDIAKQLAALQDDIRNAQAQLPRETEKAEMRDLIERLAKEIPKSVGVIEIKSVQIRDDTDHSSGSGNGPRTLSFSVELVGQQDAIIKYIDSIERNQRFMTVDTISLQSGGLTLDPISHRIVDGLHKVKLNIVTYVYNPDTKK
jgi:hypothetical protein